MSQTTSMFFTHLRLHLLGAAVRPKAEQADTLLPRAIQRMGKNRGYGVEDSKLKVNSRVLFVSREVTPVSRKFPCCLLAQRKL